MTPEIVVIGSANLDRVVQVPRLPMPGETVLGGEYREFFGGKGANQAVAARRAAGASLRAAFAGKIGTDPGGAKYVRYLEAEGLALTFLAKDESAPTGVALITVDPGGENQIAVAPGANARISPQDMEAAGEWIRGARTLLAQLEIPLETVRTAFRLGREAGVRTVLNPAPASPGARLEELLGWTDLVVPNRGEAEALAGRPVDSAESAREVCGILAAMGPEDVVITLGGDGAVFSGPQGSGHVESVAVEVRDTTGAGDAFCGALTVALTEGGDLETAVRFASVASALACTVPGAQPSLPIRPDIDKMLAGPDHPVARPAAP